MASEIPEQNGSTDKRLVIQHGAYFTNINAFSLTIQIQWKNRLTLFPYLATILPYILHMPRQPSCHAMCKNVAIALFVFGWKQNEFHYIWIVMESC